MNEKLELTFDRLNEDELEDDVLPYELEMSGISNSESQIDISLEDDLDELDIELDFDETDFLDTDEE